MEGDERSKSARSGTAGPDTVARAAGELAGELVHALRNPLAAFATSLDLLLKGEGLDASDISDLHRVLRNELRKMNDTLARTRELGRLAQLDRKPMDLRALLAARLDARAGEFAGARIRVEKSLPNDPVRLLGDATLLEVAFDALVQNALDAIHEAGGDGTLTVWLTSEPAGEQGPARARLSVRDTGHGIAEAMRRNVFRPFFTTRKGAGGMGLPVARWVALGHGGELRIDFGEQGTEAVMTIPMEDA